MNVSARHLIFLCLAVCEMEAKEWLCPTLKNCWEDQGSNCSSVQGALHFSRTLFLLQQSENTGGLCLSNGEGRAVPQTEEPGGLQSTGSRESDTTERLNSYHHHHTYQIFRNTDGSRRDVGGI